MHAPASAWCGATCGTRRFGVILRHDTDGFEGGARRLFNSPIEHLEALFDADTISEQVLRELADELSHRKSERATKLGRRVATRLDRLEQGRDHVDQLNPSMPDLQPLCLVADGLRKAVAQSGVFKHVLGGNQSRWLDERIGTVHTAQGREAEAVLLVLGAPNQSQAGARNWRGTAESAERRRDTRERSPLCCWQSSALAPCRSVQRS